MQPVYIAYLLAGNDSLSHAVSTLGLFAVGVSLSTMTAISVDRFLALHYHMRYPNLMTTHRAMYTSAILWFIVFILSFLTFWNMTAFYFVIAVCIAICLLVCTFCYISIYRIVRHHELEILAQQQAVEINAENNQNMQRSTRSAKTMHFHLLHRNDSVLYPDVYQRVSNSQ